MTLIFSQGMMKKLAVFSLLFVFVFGGVAVSGPAFGNTEAQHSVTVQVNELIVLQYPQRVRLSQVLQDAQQQLHQNAPEQTDIYWPAATLVHADREHEVEQKRAEVLEQLRSLRLHYTKKDNAEKLSATDALIAQVDQWNLGFQPYNAVDISRARQKLSDNPLLAAGHYELSLPGRPDSVVITGLVTEPGKRSFQPDFLLHDYLSIERRNNRLHAGADRDFAYLKETRGSGSERVSQVPWAYHNAQETRMRPGHIVFVGFGQFQTPWSFRNIDDTIVELLPHIVSVPEEQGAATYAAGVEDRGTLRRVATSLNQDFEPRYRTTLNDYGSVGLLQTPTARMAPEGELTLSYYDMDEYRRYTVTMQLFDWLETSAFYARLPNRRYSPFPNFSNDNIYTDKGFDVKARVWQESYWLPEVSVGLRDFAGTGLFDGEFVVANKRFGPFDFSAGVGFGRMGSRDNFTNPFCEVADRFCERSDGFSGKGGKFEYDQWFSGPAAFFGGVEYQTPLDGLRLKLEYDSNNFTKDNAGVPIEVDSPWNAGVNYQVRDWLELQASYERGNTVMLGFTIRSNLNDLMPAGDRRRSVEPREAPVHSELDSVRWRRMNERLEQQQVYTAGRFHTRTDDGGDVVTLYANPLRYRDPDRTVERAARVFADRLPESVTTYEFIEQAPFEPAVKTTVDAVQFKSQLRNELPDNSPDELDELFVRTDAGKRPDRDDENWAYNPKWRFSTNYGLNPYLQQSIGSPETFHFYQLGVTAFANRWLTSNLEIFGEAGINIANNFDRFNFTVDAFDHLPLERVRTYAREYVLNDLWMDRLEANYYHRFTDEIYGMAYAGYLERMFGGAGIEMLWRPLDSSLALGFEVARVRQRDFEGWEGFRDYEVTTGFVSAFYQMPWLKDSLLVASYGRFLAGDEGVYLNFQRRFDTGVIVGAYASFTNVSAEEYGEGSFTKGFFMSIPFDLFSRRPTRQRVSFNWTPLTRDGGQRLMRRVTLYGVTDARGPFYQR